MKKRIGVVGFGAIGRHHARNLSALGNVSLVGIADASRDARREAQALGYTAFETIDALLAERIDGIVISVPTALHYDVAMRCVDARCPFLVEKPIAHSLEAGDRLIDAARRNNVPLMVGYVERYNPAVIAVRKFMADGNLGRIFSISARRVGLMPARIADANVLIDIGVHDIDLVAFITGYTPVLKSALGGCALLNDRLDYASLALDAGGIAVDIAANWITPVKIRELFITGRHGLCHVDYVTQSARFAAARDSRPRPDFQSELKQYVAGEFTDLPVQHQEPLRQELRAFVAGLDGAPLPDPRLSLVSLRIAEEATRAVDVKLVPLMALA